MKDLFNALIEEFEEQQYDKREYMGYIMALKQGLQAEKYHSFLQELERTNWRLFFLDKNEYNVRFKIFTDDSSRCYILSFMEILQGIGYCCCDPSDTGYDGRYNCCGYGCDWYRPNFILEELNVIGYHNFVGNEHDLWDSIDEFVGITEKEKEEQIKRKQINEIEEQISILIGKLRDLKS